MQSEIFIVLLKVKKCKRTGFKLVSEKLRLKLFVGGKARFCGSIDGS
jgi:hypothetical protein